MKLEKTNEWILLNKNYFQLIPNLRKKIAKKTNKKFQNILIYCINDDDESNFFNKFLTANFAIDFNEIIRIFLKKNNL